jgi:hypothetical protein
MDKLTQYLAQDVAVARFLAYSGIAWWYRSRSPRDC